MGEPVAIEWHTGVDPLAPEPAGLVREWEALAERQGADPFRRPDWIGAWHEAFGRGRLLARAARREGQLVGLLPLERHRGVLSAPANWHTPVFGPVWADGAGVEAIAATLVGDRAHRVSIPLLDSRDPLRSALVESAGSARRRTLDVTVLRSPYLALEGDWETCWGRLGSKRRTSLKRRRRRLEERGDLSLEVVEAGAQLVGLLAEALALEALGWKGTRGSAIVSRADTRSFYFRVARAASHRGTFRLALLRVGGRLAAFDYAIEDGDRHYLVKTGFDPGLRDGAPGLVLRAMMIERAFSRGLRSYEFLGGEDAYKLEWTDTIHDRRRVQAFSPSLAGLSSWVTHRYARPAARRALDRLPR